MDPLWADPVIWRVVLPRLAQGVAWVFGLCLGLVVAVVSIEQASADLSDILASIQLHLLVTIIWLGPLLCGLGVSLAGLRMQSRGELQALSSMGIGLRSLMPMTACVGGGVVVLGWLLGELWIPDVASLKTPEWIWTQDGPLRTADGLLVRVHEAGTFGQMSISDALLQRAEPRLAPFSVLDWSGASAEVTEICARLSRFPACLGLSVVGLWALQQRRPLIFMVCSGAVLVVIEAIAWTMGAQGRLDPVFAGTVAMWTWVVPAGWLWLQPSTRSQRPL